MSGFSMFPRAVLSMLSAFAISGCERFIYGVEASNKGEYGVLVLKVGDRTAANLHNYYSKVGVNFPIIAGLHPGVGDHTAVQLYRFQGYEESLPTEVEVVWQLADLIDCKEDTWHDGSIIPGSVAWSSCTWVPLPDQVFRQELDMDEIRNSDAFLKTGKRNPDVSRSRYTLRINLVFDDSHLTTEVRNHATNPWK